MALKGSIKEFGLSEIFQLIFHQKKEGILLLKNGDILVSILFKEGKIIHAYEGDRDEKLGQNLSKAGILSGDQLVIAQYKRENVKKSLEGALVDLEFLPAAELKRLSRLFTEETIYQLFDWKTGEYEFEQKEVSYNPLLVQPLDTQFILMEAVRQIDEWPFLLKKIPSRKSVFEKMAAFSDRTPETGDKKNLDEPAEDFFGGIEEETEENEDEVDDWLLQQIDGKRSVQEIIDLAQLGAFGVHRGLTVLLAENKIQEKKTDITDFDHTETKLRRSSKKTFKYLVGGTISFLAMSVAVLSFPSFQMTSLRAARSFESIKTLSEKNERYFIRFALDLYYLKYNRYPESLRSLVEEGFFGDRKTVIENLENWRYEVETGKQDTFLLEYISLHNIYYQTLK